jgi:hypothetical protein
MPSRRCNKGVHIKVRLFRYLNRFNPIFLGRNCLQSLNDFIIIKKNNIEKGARPWGDKGGKKNKEKNQKQSSEKHKHKEENKLEKQQKGKLVELPTDKSAKKNTLVKAINGNLKAVEKSNK